MPRRTTLLALSGMLATTALLSGAPATAASAPPAVVSAVPASGTPNIADGAVYAAAQVGATMVVGGSFTQTASANPQVPVSTPYALAFDAASGALSSSFAPGLNGIVYTVLPGPTPGTVYVGGAFTTVGGAAVKSLVLLNVADGSRVSSFAMPATNGTVQTLVMAGGRLLVGGTFTTVDGVPHGGLVSLDPATGAVTPYLASNVAVHHNWTTSSPKGAAKGAVGVFRLAVSPDATKLVAIGNFKQVDGASHDQIVMWDLPASGTATLRSWNTTRLQPACLSGAFDSYVRDVAFSPDGSYFSLVNSGGYIAGALCDSASRWETASTGPSVQPTWVAYTGQDSLLSTAVTSAAIYVGGHQRWLNNPLAHDSAGPGAVPRPGVAALDPANGLPLAWNPGRNPRGAGAYTLYATTAGLWMGSDTQWIGDKTYLRGRIAFFPLAGGQPPASKAVATLPGEVYTGTGPYASPTGLAGRTFTGTASGPAQPLTSPLDVANVRGATLVGSTLFYGKADSGLYQRTTDGRTWGPETAVDPYDDPYWSTIQTGSGNVYRGMKPSFYGEIPNLTSMFYDGKGRLYYTLSGLTGLYYRDFAPDSGIISSTRMTVAGATLPDITGAFLAGGSIYYATRADGNLSRVAFNGTTVSGPATVVGGPAVDGNDWRSRVLYLGAVPPAASPIAFHGSSSVKGETATTLQVPVPSGTQAGDALLLKVSTSGTASNPQVPAGWTEVTRQTAGTALTVLWQRVATAQDTPGSTFPVTLASAIKSNTLLLAYGGTAAAPVSASAAAADAATTTTHAAPAAPVATGGSWVVRFWTDKSSGTTAWTLPTGTLRAGAYGTGTGYLTAIAADDGTAEPAGTAPALVANTDLASRAAMITVVLAPAGP